MRIMDALKGSLCQYNEQLCMVSQAIETTADDNERESLLALQSELKELIKLTQESLDALTSKESEIPQSQPINTPRDDKTALDVEYSLFMQEMAETGAYESDKAECSQNLDQKENNEDSDIEDELATLLGMKCAVYHTHKWGGQPSLHNAMVSSVVPHQNNDQFKDLQVQVLFTHPTHAEMLPCPFFLDGECKFTDDKCRYSHGTIVHLSNLKEAIEPDFDSIRIGSRVLLKLKPPDDEDITIAKKSTEKYHLWHRAVVKSVDLEKRVCTVKLEQGMKTGDKRKSRSDELQVTFEEIFPLTIDNDDDTESDNSLSDTDYPENKTTRPEPDVDGRALLMATSPIKNSDPAMGEWERHTRGIGSKLMLAMGYVPGTGLGSTGEGRVQPVEARLLPAGKSLDHCMAISEKAAAQDPLKVEQKLRRLQKKEEERNKRAYEREKEKERRNVFNFLNRTLGDKSNNPEPSEGPVIDIKQSTSKDLNIETFKIAEDTKRIEREVVKLNSSLIKYPQGSSGFKNINMQIAQKNMELDALRKKEREIAKEQTRRQNKQKMSIF